MALGCCVGGGGGGKVGKGAAEINRTLSISIAHPTAQCNAKVKYGIRMILVRGHQGDVVRAKVVKFDSVTRHHCCYFTHAKPIRLAPIM